MSFCFQRHDGSVLHDSATCECEHRILTYRFPIRDGLDVRIDAPHDLTKAETERLRVFVRTLNTETDG